jgi:general secretion pathway protein A
MYAQFYGLRESPFALTPDPRYLFLSEAHKEALASAVYGVQERKGFVLILGEVGTGKTTLIRHLLGRYGPNIRSVFVFNPAVSFIELLQLILRDLELPCPSVRRVEMIDTLNEYLLKEAAAGRYVVVIIDEAQHLSPTVLEEVRMLSNLETARGKLIQILLVGQPELGDKLARPELRQLRQRISLVAELQPLSFEDTVEYVRHRLEVAGLSGPGMFTRRALKIVHRASGGIPRLVNVLCDKALVLGYASGDKRIKGRLVKEVLKDWRPFQRTGASAARARSRAASRRRPVRRRFGKVAAAVAVGVVGAALLIMLAGQRDGDWLGRIRHGLRPTRASGTVVQPANAPVSEPASSEAAAGQTTHPGPATAAVSALPPWTGRPAMAPGPVEAAVPDLPAASRADAARPRPSETADPPAAPPREVVVAPGDVFSGLVSRKYGRADLTLLDFVKAANPEVTSVDVLLVGQRIKMPPFDAAALVQTTDDGRYRLHLLTVWDAGTPAVAKLRSLVAAQGRQTYMVPVQLIPRETAYRVLVGDFASRREAETYYRDVRLPAGLSTQLWRQS